MLRIMGTAWIVLFSAMNLMAFQGLGSIKGQVKNKDGLALSRAVVTVVKTKQNTVIVPSRLIYYNYI